MSDLEREFLFYWKAFGGKPSDWKPEFRFHATRKWRFDFADPASLVSLELDGGVFVQGRHSRGKGYEADLEKLNTALSMGWKVFRLTRGMLAKEPFRWMGMIKEAREQAAGKV